MGRAGLVRAHPTLVIFVSEGGAAIYKAYQSVCSRINTQQVPDKWTHLLGDMAQTQRNNTDTEKYFGVGILTQVFLAKG